MGPKNKQGGKNTRAHGRATSRSRWHIPNKARDIKLAQENLERSVFVECRDSRQDKAVINGKGLIVRHWWAEYAILSGVKPLL